MKQHELKEGIHFYQDDDGNFVFSKQYLLEKGSCCGMGCLHCPYNYEAVAEHLRNNLIKARAKKENS